MGRIDGMFDSTISLIGLSKAYGLAAIRGGAIIAPASINRGIRNLIFQQTDSTPVIQAAAMAGAFTTDKSYEKEYKKYFSYVTETYYYRYNLLKALIDGIENVDSKYQSKIKKVVNKFYPNNIAKKMLQGIQGVKLVENLKIKGGFFALVDFTDLKGKSAKEYTITDEFELLKYLYKYGRIKFILGRSIGWGNEDEIIGRFTYALPEKDIIVAMNYLGKLVGELK